MFAKGFYFSSLLAIASENPNGFTVSVDNLQPVQTGFAVAVAETQNSFNFEGLDRVIKYAMEHREINAFGGWLDTTENKWYWDATVICQDLETAISLGLRNGHKAIFDLANLEEIRLDVISK